MKRDLDWFSFENKMRHLIFEVVGNHIALSELHLSNTVNLEPITGRIDLFEKKIQDFKAELESFK